MLRVSDTQPFKHMCVNLLFMYSCMFVCVCVCFILFCLFVFFVCAHLADHQVSPQVRVEMMWAFEIVAPDKNDIVAG